MSMCCNRWGGAQPTRLWSEAQLVANLKALYDMATGISKVDTMQFSSAVGPLCRYSPSGEQRQYSNHSREWTMPLRCEHGSQQVATLHRQQFQLSGRKQVPGRSGVDQRQQTSRVPAPLQACSRYANRLGASGSVVGIEIGTADVPVSVYQWVSCHQGRDTVVSGGKVRWDVESDLTCC